MSEFSAVFDIIPNMEQRTDQLLKILCGSDDWVGNTISMTDSCMYGLERLILRSLVERGISVQELVPIVPHGLIYRRFQSTKNLNVRNIDPELFGLRHTDMHWVDGYGIWDKKLCRMIWGTDYSVDVVNDLRVVDHILTSSRPRERLYAYRRWGLV